MSAPPSRTLLAVGAHAGDMELTAGAVLARHVRQGDRVVLLHLTLGEEGHPGMDPRSYGAQKRREAETAAEAIGAEVRFGPWRDGRLQADEPTIRWMAAVIREVRPTHVLAHWRASLHPDHIAAHQIVVRSILPAALQDAEAGGSPWGGVVALYFTENWEDEAGFSPYVIVDVSDALDVWEQCVRSYEFVRGGISRFPYLDYYRALARVRGARHGFQYAVAFDVEEHSRRQVHGLLP